MTRTRTWISKCFSSRLKRSMYTCSYNMRRVKLYPLYPLFGPGQTKTNVEVRFLCLCLCESHWKQDQQRTSTATGFLLVSHSPPTPLLYLHPINLMTDLMVCRDMSLHGSYCASWHAKDRAHGRDSALNPCSQGSLHGLLLVARAGPYPSLS